MHNLQSFAIIKYNVRVFVKILLSCLLNRACFKRS